MYSSIVLVVASNNWMPTLLNRPKGRPKDRWWYSVRGDLKIVGVLDWKKCVVDRKY
jgi:hypothetical protein